MLYLSAIGAVNGGVTITVVDENANEVFRSTGTAPTSSTLNPSTGTFLYNGSSVSIALRNNSNQYIGVSLDGALKTYIKVYPEGQNTSFGFNKFYPLFFKVKERTFFKYEFMDGSYFIVGNRSYYFTSDLFDSYVNSTIVIPSLVFMKGVSSFNKIDKYGNTWFCDGIVLKFNNTTITLQDNVVYWFYLNEGTRNIAYSGYLIGSISNQSSHRVSFMNGINEQYDSTYAESIIESNEYINTGATGITINYVKNDTFGGSVLFFGGSPDHYVSGYTGTLFFGEGYESYLLSSTNDFPAEMEVYEIGDYTPIPYPPDPFEPGGTTGGDDTGTEGGAGDFDGEGDAIAEPELPSLSSTDSGFLSLYNPTLAQIQALGAFMWSDSFSLDSFKKLFSDPMQAILGLSIVPVRPGSTTTVSVVLGNVDTGVSMPLVTNQYVHKELGTITLSEFWGAYLDYSPYTKVEIYLPYIGVKTLNTDDVMGKTIKLSYNIDLLTGACVAMLVVGGSLLYQFTGACASSVPITANDWTNVINGILSTAGKVAAVAMSGGLSSPLLPGTISSTASTVASMKPSVDKSGSMQGMPGLLASDRPFLIVTRPRQALPTNQKHFTGYPSFVTRTLGSVSGYTVVDDIHLEDMTCTDTEKEEIRRLLKEGVIL